jgi:hypothetical protein
MKCPLQINGRTFINVLFCMLSIAFEFHLQKNMILLFVLHFFLLLVRIIILFLIADGICSTYRHKVWCRYIIFMSFISWLSKVLSKIYYTGLLPLMYLNSALLVVLRHAKDSEGTAYGKINLAKIILTKVALNYCQ